MNKLESMLEFIAYPLIWLLTAVAISAIVVTGSFITVKVLGLGGCS